MYELCAGACCVWYWYVFLLDAMCEADHFQAGGYHSSGLAYGPPLPFHGFEGNCTKKRRVGRPRLRSCSPRCSNRHRLIPMKGRSRMECQWMGVCRIWSGNCLWRRETDRRMCKTAGRCICTTRAWFGGDCAIEEGYPDYWTKEGERNRWHQHHMVTTGENSDC